MINSVGYVDTVISILKDELGDNIKLIGSRSFPGLPITETTDHNYIVNADEYDSEAELFAVLGFESLSNVSHHYSRTSSCTGTLEVISRTINGVKIDLIFKTDYAAFSRMWDNIPVRYYIAYLWKKSGVSMEDLSARIGVLLEMEKCRDIG